MAQGCRHGGDDPWGVEAEPTTLVALWPHREPPTKTQVLAAAAAKGLALGEIDRLDPGGRDVVWGMVAALPDADEPLLVWCERARPLSPDDVSDPRALACEWAIGLETILGRDDPLVRFGALLRLLAGSLDDLPAILDAGGMRWFEREALDTLLRDPDSLPPPEAMWIIHAVAGRGEGAWLHTHGLRRAGVPELEMLGVAAPHVQRASELLNAIGARLLDEPAPAPGQTFEAGVDLPVVLVPWREAVACLRPGAPGGADGREGIVHAGPGAVVCAVPTGGGPAADGWRYPREVLERLDHDDVVLYFSQRATERAAARARATWSRLALAFAGLSPARRRHDAPPPRPGGERAARFLIKAGLACGDGADAAREHLWFVTQRFEADRAQGLLLNEPLHVGGLRRGDLIWIERGEVSDWSVITPGGTFGPDDLPGLEDALRALAGNGGSR
jgi:hypothetical protein